MEVKIEGNELVIRIKMADAPTLTASGKSRIVASGLRRILLEKYNREMVVSLNAWMPAKEGDTISLQIE